MKKFEKIILAIVLVAIIGALALGATALAKNWDKVFPEDTNVSTQTPNEDGDTEEELESIEYLTAEKYYYSSSSMSGVYSDMFSFKFDGDSFDNLTLGIRFDSPENENFNVRATEYEGTKYLLTASVKSENDFQLLYDTETKELYKYPELRSGAFVDYLNYIVRYSNVEMH